MSQKDSTIVDLGNLVVKGIPSSQLITMAKSHKETTSKEALEARATAERMRAEKLAKIEEAKKLAKKLVFLNSTKYQTAKSKAEKLTKPEDKIIFRNSSRNFNHLHAVKTQIHYI